MITDRETWSPGWEARIGEAVRSLGYNSLTELLASMPAKSYEAVANRLGTSFAPIQLISEQFREAKSTGKIRQAAKDSLCRNILEAFPDGWGVGTKPDWRMVKALSSWSSEIIATGNLPALEETLDKIIQRLRNSPPPVGWIPVGADDPMIVELFDEHWPEKV